MLRFLLHLHAELMGYTEGSGNIIRSPYVGDTCFLDWKTGLQALMTCYNNRLDCILLPFGEYLLLLVSFASMIYMLLYLVSKVWLFFLACCAGSGDRDKSLWGHPLLLPPKPYRRPAYPKKRWPSVDPDGDDGSSTEEESSGEVGSELDAPSLFRQNDDFNHDEDSGDEESESDNEEPIAIVETIVVGIVGGL